MIKESPARSQPIHPEWLIPNLIDHFAQSQPHDILYKFPASSHSYDDGFTDVTYESFANAVNGAAQWLESTLGRSDNEEVLAYMGPNDCRYMVFIVAALKVGYVLLLVSPRNSIAVQQTLFESTGCQKLISSFTDSSPNASLAESTNVASFQAPSIDELLQSTFGKYRYDKTFDINKGEAFLILHTSGSTGPPKPIRYTHDFAASIVRVARLQPPDGYFSIYDLFTNRKIFSILPNFHIAGIHLNFLLALSNHVSVAMPLSSRPPTAFDLADALGHVEVDLVGGSPLLCQELADNPKVLDAVASQVTYLTFGGGSCPLHIGRKVAEKIKLFTIVGSTEIGGQCLIKPMSEWANDEWNYIQPHPSWIAKFRHFDGDLYEQFFIKDKDHGGSDTIFKIFPEESEISSKDLYSPHPTKPDLWTHKGRIDDIIVFLNGEKTNPIQFESTVSSHPEVSAALVAGAQRFQAALLVEPVAILENPQDRANFMEKIWSVIEEANAKCPGHARIVRSQVLLTLPKKPMQRAGKGTVQRQLTLSAYEKELDSLYENVGPQKAADCSKSPARVSDLSPTELTDIVQRTAASVMHRDLQRYDDLFERGLDSLQVVQLTQGIKEAVDCAALAPKLVYTNPTIGKISTAIRNLDLDSELMQKETRDAQRQQIQDSLKVYGQDLAKLSHHVDHQGAILLTGSTGAIGSYLLQEFVRYSPSRRIFCLNRSADSKNVQTQRNKGRGLSTTWDSANITFLTGDLSAQKFKLTNDQFATLERNVTEIVHAAWPVNFNIPFSSFGTHLAGIVGLITFASNCGRSRKRPRITFLSSISSVYGLAASADFRGKKIPEQYFTDPSTPDGNGYAASKHVAELLLVRASEELDVPCSIHRIGQVAGPSVNCEKGLWAAQEWVPSLVISSATLGAVPASLGGTGSNEDKSKLADLIDWIPIDEVAKVIAELIGVNGNSDPAIEERRHLEIFHLTNPSHTTWSKLLPTVMDAMGPYCSQPLEKVSFQAWVAKLEAFAQDSLGSSKETSEVIAKVPGIKLLDFYLGLVNIDNTGNGKIILDTARSEKCSPRLRNMDSISPKQMASWVEGWMRLS